MDIIQYLDQQNPCSLVLHPMGINVGRAAAVIAQRVRFPVTPTYVITWDYENAYQSLEVVQAQNDIRIISYDKVGDLDTLSKGLVVFDDLRSVCNLFQLSNTEGLNSIKELLQRANGVLILATQGVSESDVLQLSEVIPTAGMWYTSFMDLGQDIKYISHLSKMTERQDFLYQIRIQNEGNQSTDWKLEQRASSQEICNIAFPEGIQNYLDAPSSVQLSPLTPEQIIKNVGYTELYTNAPKIQQLILTIMSHSNQRHLLFTRYEGVYGLGLIQAIISQINENPLIVPKLQIICITRQMTENEKLDRMKLFNSSPDAPFIMVTDAVLPSTVPPLNIDHYHLLDGALYTGLQMTYLIYKYRNYPGRAMPPLLTIHNHICQRSDRFDSANTQISGGDAIDAVYYNQFSKQVQIDIKYWQRLVTAAPSIVASKDRLTLNI